MSDEPYSGIAIVGIAGRFPGAATVEELWANLVAGRESISFFSDGELVESGLDPGELRRRGQYVAARGILEDADRFDAAFFGIHPKEAEVMDPQHRVFLETCWEAIERAGYPPTKVQGAVGLFAGATYNTYYLHALHPRPELIELVGSDLAMFGNEKDYLATRVAYKLGLTGPALNVSTACSTSLVAVCQACQSLLTYQCDMALAGAASVTVPQRRGYYFDEGNIGSADGHTRTFDARAAGTVFSNGVGVVVLKRVEDAVKDGDRIFAVIKGTAVNNDGSQRMSFGAPGIEGQSEVITMAHAFAGIDPETITYVEAHGTATPLGDPIEVAALTKAFRRGTDARQFCGLGSIKSNIGHLDVASGVAGLIKTALSLDAQVIPASLHFTQPNPKLDLENSPFYVNSALQEWKTSPGVPRRAGVSSFGTGGTNAHAVLEEAPRLGTSDPSRTWQLLVLSAKTHEALERATSNFAAHLEQMNSGCDEAARELADVAFTLQRGRVEFRHRRIAVCQDAAEGARILAGRDAKRVFTHEQQLTDPPVVFLFPGQGAQYAGMGAALYRSEAVFKDEVDRCAALLEPLLGCDLRDILFPSGEPDSERRLTQTRFTQPALFTIEYSLAKLWMSWGIRPSAMIGHSVGEYVAACVSGVFSLEDAVTLVARRAALVDQQPAGAMLAVRLAEKELAPLLNGKLAIAAVNAPKLSVVSGPHEAIAALEAQLESRRIAAKRLLTSHAFHSPMMEPVLAPFTAILRQVEFHAPQIPFISNVTAEWSTADQVQDPGYWSSHVRQAVRFADGIAELAKDPNRILLEVGPGQTLTALARQHPAKSPEQVVLASLGLSGADELRGLLETLGRLWSAGVAVDWESFYAGERRRRAVLPTYPFERKRYWPESPMSAQLAVKTDPAINAARPTHDTSVDTPASAAPGPAETSSLPRNQRLLVSSRLLLEELCGYDLSSADPAASLLELGLDSLLLTQASHLLQRKFGVPISFRQLMEELGSLASIAAHLDATLPPETFAEPVPALPAVQTDVPASINLQGSALEQLLLQQQHITSQLLQMCGRRPTVQLPPVHSAPAQHAPIPQTEFKAHGPFKPTERGAGLSLSPKQSGALEALISRYTRRSAASKKAASENRPILADPRSAAGFKQLWKEMVYPIVTTRSDGSRVWDLDGNEYVDFVMGFGASMFGHRPRFVTDAVHRQLDLGFEIGPIQPLAGEVASLMREFTGMQRVGFTNTGSEAVLAATRVARTVTGRDKIAVFAGAYHGIFDEVLFRPLAVNGEVRTAPIAPGIPGSAVGQVIVLDYGNPESLEILRACGSEIAAVLVEPVQSRRLDLQPVEFLRELRRITAETGTALVFDEVVTGFRVHPGGAQALFGIRADLATYGKVIGGGLPVGVIAGDSRFMDALDGGQWQYGDTSFPEVGVTFFAGTFVRHPLALAAAKAVLTHMKQAGPELQIDLTNRTEKAAATLRAVIDECRAPYQITQFSSLMQLTFPPDQKLAGLLFYLMRERGIHMWENRALVMTTTHSDSDIALLVAALRESLAEMQAADFVASARVVKSNAVTSLPAAHRLLSTEPVTIPLTEAQKEIWLAAQLGGKAALGYNESLRLEFRGDFEPELFRAAVHQILERHPILLARLSEDGQSQQLQPDAEFEIPLVELDELDPAAQDREMERLIEREISEPFDLTAGPLLRVFIARLSREHHICTWTAHHIICDGWSGGLVVSELGRVYSALKQRIPPVLEEPASFRGYALDSEAGGVQLDQALGYWREQFTTFAPPLELPTDRPRPLVRSAAAATQRRFLDALLQQSLKRVAGQQRTTPVVLFMAALKTLLYRLTGQTDLVIGLGAAGQPMTSNSCLVGHCVNLLPVRTRFEPEAGFEENLGAVRKSVLDAYDHQQATLGGILQHLKAPRTPGRVPLVEVIFNVDRDPGAAAFDGLSLSCQRNPKRALHFDLFFNLVDGSSGLTVECDYNTDLFDAATIDRWLGHYETVLRTIATDPARTVAKVPLLNEAERRELLVEWNETGVKYPNRQTLHEWFESQVEKTPEVHAVTFEDRHLTYEELNRRANQLAHHLRKLGVGPDVLVGLYLERSLEMVVGLLGILKAGGAYVPIDPEYPAERVEFMLRDAGTSVLLIQSRLANDLPPHKGRTVCLDDDWDLIAHENSANPANVAGPDNLAYVIYTSGSTGAPKGAMNTHRGICNRLLWMQDQYRLTEADKVLQKTPFSFDVSVWEFFWPLLVGARLVVVKPGGHRDPGYLVELIASQRITISHFVPSMLAVFLAEPGAEQCRSLRHVICSGEALSFSLQEEFFRLLPAELHNLYGPTEAAVDVTHWTCRRNSRRRIVPIGRPVANTQIYLLDQYEQPVPIGVPGELHIGGVQVGRGYHNRPELTAERFVRDPFSAGNEQRLYKTGDLCRWLPDGNIEYLGRMDFQVKIRGLRIELGEIEAVLARHESVRQCVVSAHEHAPGDKQLVAYVEPHAGASPAVNDLRAHIKRELPEYMIPSAFVVLAKFPLNANGKIDPKALPSPDNHRMQIDSEFVPARDPLEQTLAQVWSQALKVRRVGLRDNFFELGGHSLLAVRIISEIEKLSGKRLPLAVLLRAPTIGDLAEVLRRENWEPTWSSLVPIRSGGSKPPLFLMHSHGGNVLEYQALANYLESDQPVYAFQARGLNGHIARNRSIEEMATEYLEELRSLQPHGPYFLGGFCFGGLIALEAAQQLSAAGEEVALVALIQTSHPGLRFKPETTLIQRLWYRTTKRLDLERENLAYRGAGHIRQRARHLWDIGKARAQIALDEAFDKDPSRRDRMSNSYILESLGLEHDKAFERYSPHVYFANAILFRASKQLSGLDTDQSLGWNGIFHGSFEIHEVPGHQQNMLIEPNVRQLAAQLSDRLNVAQERCGTGADRALVGV
jgi:amino acid adenylation domain-containing protein